MSSEINLDYLPLVAEEAAEVIQACMKIQRFGVDSSHPKDVGFDGRTNYHNLCYEVGDLLEVISKLNLSEDLVKTGRLRKVERLTIYGPERYENKNL